jgi:26S proteasome regulatory subunit N2
MEAVLDNHFPLSYRDQVLNFLYPLFPSPTIDSKSPYIHSLTRLLVTLSNPTLTVSLLVSLVPQEKLVAYQLAFDLVEGGAQDFLETIRNDLPEGDEVGIPIVQSVRGTNLIGPGRQTYLRRLAQDSRWTGVCETLS